jgi:hypothetical protein
MEHQSIGFLTRRPQKTFLARLAEDEMEALKEFAIKNSLSINQVIRILANNLKESLANEKK